MEVLNLTVPKNKHPFVFLAEMGGQCKNAWIFIHQSVVESLKDKNLLVPRRDINNNNNIYSYLGGESIEFSEFGPEEWYIIIKINKDDILFKEICSSEDLECIIKLQMEV